MIFFKMICKRCQEEIKKLPLNEAIKKREWWRQEFKDFGWSNLLILLAILLIFSGFYFEFAPKIKNPCDWCMIQHDTLSGEPTKISCSEFVDNMNPEINKGGDLNEGHISFIPAG